MLRSGRIGVAVAALGIASLATGCASHRNVTRIAAVRPGRAYRRVVTAVRIGRSVSGRPIDAVEIGRVRRPRADLLVVGIIHGNEQAGETVVARLRRVLPALPLDAWLVADLNPDGRARNTRQNARGVDLNRNFPLHWRPLGPKGTQQYAGTGPLSEPESRAAYGLIERIRPRISIWFHQPLGVVDESGGSVAIERRFSSLSGLPLRRLQRYPGSAVGWEDHAIPGSTAFVVELPPGPLDSRRAARLARAVELTAMP